MATIESLFGRPFDSAVEARAALDAVALPLGYNLVRHRPKSNSVEFRCSKGRRFKSQGNPGLPDSQRRKTSSQMTGCPFRLVIYRDHVGSPWMIRRSGNDSANQHNHELLSPSVHSRYRNITIEKRKSTIISMYNSGIRPIQILAQIQAEGTPDVKGLTRHDIYNTILRHRRQELGSRTPMQWLFDQLKDDELYIYEDRRDEQNRLIALYISPKSAIELYRQYSSVIFMDSTYKTNQFNMPLFNICGVTSMKKSFQIAAVFLSGETQSHYNWAIGVFHRLLIQFEIPRPTVIVTDRELALMKALEDYPSTNAAAHILCRWHVNMNVLARTKQYFPKASYNRQTKRTERAPLFKSFLKDWNNLISSPTEEDYNRRLAAMSKPQAGRAAYPDKAIEYITQTWLWPWKKKIVRCWVDQQRHFGHTTTSIAESLHSSLKKFIISSGGDLATVFSRLTSFWRHQQLEIQNQRGLRMHKILNSTRQLLFSIVRERITHVALTLITQELQFADNFWKNRDRSVTIPSCNPCAFNVIYGLPCRHMLMRKMQEREPIQLYDIHQFWFWETTTDEDITPPAPYEPSVVRGKGRPQGSLNLKKPSRDTTRDPSQFELVIRIENQEAREDRQQQPPPPSTAPVIMRSKSSDNAGEIAPISTTAAGLRVLQVVDTYESGTANQRASQRTLQQLEDREYKWINQINPEVENEMDQAWEFVVLDAVAMAEGRAFE